MGVPAGVSIWVGVSPVSLVTEDLLSVEGYRAISNFIFKLLICLIFLIILVTSRRKKILLKLDLSVLTDLTYHFS